ncbi:MAG: hypothetical protein ACP6IQ_02025 [Candidatus Njordarchaeia archaeon]
MTSEETYYTMGLFTSLKEAKKAIQCDDTEYLTEFGMENEYEKIVIKERELNKLDWSNIGKTVYTIERIYNFETEKWQVKQNIK